MAQVLFSGLVSDMRGKLQGSQFTKGRTGNVLQNKASQRFKGSQKASLSKSRQRTVAQAWKTLTDSQRTDWTNLSQNYSYTNKFGNQYNLNGYNFFCKCNSNRLLLGYSIILAAPPIVSFNAISLQEFEVRAFSTGALQTANFTLQNTWFKTGHEIVVGITLPMSQGVSTPNIQFSFIPTPAATVTVFSISSEYSQMARAIYAGQRVFLRLKIVDSVSGIDTAYSQFNTIVQPSV